MTRRSVRLPGCCVIVVGLVATAFGAAGEELPLRQSRLTRETAGAPLPVDLDAAGHDDRWLGAGIRFHDMEGAEDVRWSPDSRSLYFQWSPDPQPGEDPDLDPWYRVDRDGRKAERVPDAEALSIPAARVSWSASGDRAAWASGGRVYFFDAHSDTTRLIYSAAAAVDAVRMRPDGRAVRLVLAGDLWEWQADTGALRQRTRRVELPAAPTEQARWLRGQQQELFATLREREARRQTREARSRVEVGIQAIPLEEGWVLDDVRLSPDERFVVFRAHKPARGHVRTSYADYVTASGYTEAKEARAKVGDPADEHRFGIVAVAPREDPERIAVKWVALNDGAAKNAIIDGPTWGPDGSHAVVQVMSLGNKDRWICSLDVTSGTLTALVHDHDDAWLGGPPPVFGYLHPALFEWLADGRFVFASERTGFCHLYLAEPDGRIRALTRGTWEVRDAALSRDRSHWLVTAGREDPQDDDLYLMAADGGPLTRLTRRAGRNAGLLSPDGTRLAIVQSDAIQLPDLFLTTPVPDGPLTRITESGTDQFYRHRLLRPTVVSFPLPSDGKPVWAAVYDPPPDKKNGAALLHIHGGGYRQFTHHGYSVYGWRLHLGLLHFLVEQGYTVLDLDYRGSAGYGRDYRTDIYEAMGGKDVEGGVAAVDWLVRERGVDRSRVGIYGLSYGGFFTEMALFRHPGVFAAGVANAGVSDWAHYSQLWTSRVLGVPATDAAAYERSSPIYFAGALQDPLLIVHGLADGNVQFQDTARLVQRLIELHKPFEVAIYPVERHGLREESSVRDYVGRVASFFARHVGAAPRDGR